MWWLVIIVLYTVNEIHAIPLPNEEVCRKVEASFVEFVKLETMWGYATACWNKPPKNDEIKAPYDPYYP